MDINATQYPHLSHDQLGRPEQVGLLAGQVLAMLRGREARGGMIGRMQIGALSGQVIEAALAPEADALDRLAASLAGERISTDTLCFQVMPVAARDLGTAWEEDRLSFVDVSLAMLRIQRFVRDAMRSVPQRGDNAGGTILLVLPQQEQHSLGVVLMAARMQRLGVNVVLLIGEETSRVCDRAARGACDAVMISVGCEERLADVNHLVEMLHSAVSPVPPVILGGALLCAKGPDQLRAIEGQTGVQLATVDLNMALRTLKATVDAFHGMELV
jgi:methylmalonyl-CoA mutase cobalamin-binding subunit